MNFNNSTKEAIGRRVGLNLKATKYIEEAIIKLKEGKDFIKINESKLVSEILIRFFKRYYKKDKEHLEKIFFDKRSYLKSIIKSSKSDEELFDSMKTYLNSGKRKGK